MKREWRHVLLCCVAGLLFFMLVSMAESSAAADDAAEALPVETCVTLEAVRGEPPQCDCGTVHAAERSGMLRAYIRMRETDAACAQVTDRNGYPMGNRAYIRTVYAAFPPERLHG